MLDSSGDREEIPLNLFSAQGTNMILCTTWMWTVVKLLLYTSHLWYLPCKLSDTSAIDSKPSFQTYKVVN